MSFLVGMGPVLCKTAALSATLGVGGAIFKKGSVVEKALIVVATTSAGMALVIFGTFSTPLTAIGLAMGGIIGSDNDFGQKKDSTAVKVQKVIAGMMIGGVVGYVLSPYLSIRTLAILYFAN